MTRRATRTDPIVSPTTKTAVFHVVSSDASDSGVAPVFVTTPALTSPIRAMNAPIPIPIARLRSIGIAFRIISRTLVSTRIVIRTPSATITPIAWGNVSPSAATSVNATNAFSPRPAAKANG